MNREDFVTRRAQLNTLYRCTLQFCNRVYGGIPAVPNDDKGHNILRAWVLSQAKDLPEEEVEARVAQTIQERLEETEDKITQTFKLTPEGYLCLEGRQAKAMLKETASRLGIGKQKLMAEFREAVHVDEELIALTRCQEIPALTDFYVEPDGYKVSAVHVQTPQGPRTALKRSAYLVKPYLSFTIRRLTGSRITKEHLIDCLTFGQDIGLGAMHSQGEGKFEVFLFEEP